MTRSKLTETVTRSTAPLGSAIAILFFATLARADDTGAPPKTSNSPEAADRAAARLCIAKSQTFTRDANGKIVCKPLAGKVKSG